MRIIVTQKKSWRERWRVHENYDCILTVHFALYSQYITLSHITHVHSITVVGVREERRTKVGPLVITEKAAPVTYSNYLEDCRPCAGGLSAVKAIGTQMRDLINSNRD